MSDQPATLDTFFGFTRDHTPGSEAFAALEPDLPAARELGVRATPTFFFGQVRLDGAVPYAELAQAAATA